MKRLHVFHLWEGPQACMFKEMLVHEGIACLVKNDRLSAGMGEIPFVECFPELWLVDEETYPRARLLLDGWLAKDTDPDTEPWTCPVCGELSEPHFEICWNCSCTRD